MMNTAPAALDFPALDGRPVTEAHVRDCRENGHAAHTVDGVPTGVCPRCGEVDAMIADTVEFLVCADCAIVIANGDASGIEDAESHLAAMDRELATVRDVVIVGDADLGFHADTCGGCGYFAATDDWHGAIATRR
jgi:hypothetical protein